MGYHEAVLLDESIAGLSIQPNGIYVDVTFGVAVIPNPYYKN